MIPETHKDIAAAVATAMGMEDQRQVLVFASVYPDVKDRENSEDFWKCEELGIWDDEFIFLSNHHSAKQVRDIRGSIERARDYYLHGDLMQCNKWLGIALHFIADAMCPYCTTKGTREWKQHNEFERKCNQCVRQLRLEKVQVEEMVPHAVVSYVAKRVRAGWRTEEAMQQVTLLLTEVYRVSLQAARAVYAPKRYQSSEKEIQEIKGIRASCGPENREACNEWIEGIQRSTPKWYLKPIGQVESK